MIVSTNTAAAKLTFAETIVSLAHAVKPSDMMDHVHQLADVLENRRLYLALMDAREDLGRMILWQYVATVAASNEVKARAWHLSALASPCDATRVALMAVAKSLSDDPTIAASAEYADMGGALWLQMASCHNDNAGEVAAAIRG